MKPTLIILSNMLTHEYLPSVTAFASDIVGGACQSLQGSGHRAALRSRTQKGQKHLRWREVVVQSFLQRKACQKKSGQQTQQSLDKSNFNQSENTTGPKAGADGVKKAHRHQFSPSGWLNVTYVCMCARKYAYAVSGSCRFSWSLYVLQQGSRGERKDVQQPTTHNGERFYWQYIYNIISTLHELHEAISVSSQILLKRIKETSIPSCRGFGWWWVLPKFIIHLLNTNQVSGEYFQGRVRLKYKKQSYKA